MYCGLSDRILRNYIFVKRGLSSIGVLVIQASNVPYNLLLEQK